MNIEQEFYNTFGIEPVYPNITAEKLLEMICLINKNTKYYNKSTYFKENYKNLKDEILEKTLYCYKTNCLFNKEKEQFKQQIQSLFKEK